MEVIHTCSVAQPVLFYHFCFILLVVHLSFTFSVTFPKRFPPIMMLLTDTRKPTADCHPVGIDSFTVVFDILMVVFNHKCFYLQNQET